MIFQNWPKRTKVFMLLALVLFLCLVLQMLYALIGHQLIKAMYDGRFVPILNKIIEGQAAAMFPLEFYFRKADLIFFKFQCFCFLLIFYAIVCMLNPRNRIGRFLKALFIYSSTAFFILHLFMLNWSCFRDDNAAYGFNQMMAHTAHRPFAYRALAPIFINASSSLFPEKFVESQKRWLTDSSPVLKYERKKILNANARLSLKCHLMYLYVFLSLVLLLFSTRYLTSLIYTLPAPVSDLLPVIGALFLPLTFLHGGYFYDFPELLFMSLCLICLIKQKWVFYYILFCLAILNKEANILLILFFMAFSLKRLPKSSIIKHLAIHIFLGSSITIFMLYLFANNPGVTIIIELEKNIKFWLDPRAYFLFFDPYYFGLPIFPRGANILTIIFVSFLVFYSWEEKPQYLKRLFIYTCAINIPILIFRCNIDEVRNLSFIFPSIYLLGVYSICKLFLYNKSSALKLKVCMTEKP